jgi:DNA-binding NtrC family response regulator
LQTILLLEDQDAVMRMLRLVLACNGRRILEATTVEQGLTVASNQRLDLLIADVFVGEGCGIQLAVQLRKFHPGLKIILSSGYPTSMWGEERNEALAQLGREGVSLLEKPFRPAQLRSTVAELIAPPSKRPHRSAAG